MGWRVDSASRCRQEYSRVPVKILQYVAEQEVHLACQKP